MGDAGGAIACSQGTVACCWPSLMTLLTALPDIFSTFSTSYGLACREEIELAELQRIMVPIKPQPAKQQQASAQKVTAAGQGGGLEQQRMQSQAQQHVQQQAPQQAQQQAPLGSPQQSALASHHTQLDGQPGAAEDTAATVTVAAPPSTVRQRHANRLISSPPPAATGKAGEDAGGEESHPAAAAPAEGQQGASLAGTAAAGLASHPGQLAAAGKHGRQARVLDSESEREEEEQAEDGRCGRLAGVLEIID